MKLQRARKNNHRCDLCFRRIPKGDKYWRKYEEGGEPDGSLTDRKEHTNCELYRGQPLLDLMGEPDPFVQEPTK